MFVWIGTGKYCELAKAGIENWNNNLIKDDYTVGHLLLTDRHSASLWYGLQPLATIRYAPHLPFPLPTLLRYHFFLENIDILEKYDYIYFVNADMRIQGQWSVKELLPQEGFNLVGISHPGFHTLEGARGSFEINTNSSASLAHIVSGHGITRVNGLTDKYIIGAFQGGKAKEFLTMCDFIKIAIDRDLKKRIMAIWDDESYMNHYAQTIEKFQVLLPTYCQPEGWDSFGPTKILKLNKNHKEIRS